MRVSWLQRSRYEISVVASVYERLSHGPAYTLYKAGHDRKSAIKPYLHPPSFFALHETCQPTLLGYGRRCRASSFNLGSTVRIPPCRITYPEGTPGRRPPRALQFLTDHPCRLRSQPALPFQRAYPPHLSLPLPLPSPVAAHQFLPPSARLRIRLPVVAYPVALPRVAAEAHPLPTSQRPVLRDVRRVSKHGQWELALGFLLLFCFELRRTMDRT